MKKRNDYKYKSFRHPRNPDRELFQVHLGGDVLVTTCRSESEAVEVCKNLNIDPWFLDRGQTRDDRNAKL